jgi:predicted GNAT family N-acyltransferase
MEKAQFQKDIYKAATEALGKSALKDTILEYSGLAKRIKYILVQNSKDMRTLWQLRKEVFVREEGYPSSSIRNILDRGAVHFLAVKDNTPVGSISIYLNSITGLPLEKTLKADLGTYKIEKMAEIGKLAVLPNYRKTTIPLGLMVVAYEFIKLCEIERICIFTLSNKKENLEIYKRFGFKKILEFPIFNSKNATCMVLNIIKDSFYEKALLLNQRRANLAKQLAKMLSFKI